jgi:DNA-binding LacI/PurR family transcriptional regulator
MPAERKKNPPKTPSNGKIARRVTLRDIAEKLGISRMTVSLALRDAPHVAQATKRKVLVLSRKLGFSPDPKVAKLMSDLAHLRRAPAYQGELAILTSLESEYAWKESYHFSGCYRGAEKRALELGYRLTPFWTRDPQFDKKRLSSILYARGIRGIIIAPLSVEVAGVTNSVLDLDWKRFCLVHLGATLLRPELNLVRHNHFHGMRHSLDQLESHGYRRIGFAIVESGDILSSRLWTAAYLHWRNRRGMDAALPGFVYPWGVFPEDRFCDWIRDHQIDAVVTMKGDLYPAIKRIQKSLSRHVGFSVLDQPGDKSSFSGIDQNAAELGRVAVDQLVHAMNHNLTGLPKHPLQTLIQGRWHEAASTRKLRGHHPPAPLERIKLMHDHF